MANKKKSAKKPAKKLAKKTAKKATKTPAKLAAKKSVKKPAKIEVKKAATKSATSLANFHPLDDRVLVERESAFEKTAGGLFIPATATEAPNRGTVISVGPGHLGKKGNLRPTDVKPGQVVVFGKYSGNEIKLDGKDFVIIRETDIIGIVEE